MSIPTESIEDEQPIREPLLPEEALVIQHLHEFAPVIDGRHCFHTPEGQDDLFWPNRKIGPEALGRMNTLRNCARESIWRLEPHIPSGALRSELRTMLVDLIEANAFGRLYEIASQAGDLIPAIKSNGDPKLKNCIAMIINRKRLATIGGFHDPMKAEALTQTTAREGLEEAKGHMSNFVFIGEQSNPIRDERKPIVSAVSMALTDVESLEQGDDAEKVVIIKIFDDNGNLTPEALLAGDHVDARGVPYSHIGPRADHSMIIYENLNKFFKKFRKDPTEPLEDVVRRMSGTIDQKWYQFDPTQFHEDKYEKVSVDNVDMLMTPNMLFVREKARDILRLAGVPDEQADAAALSFMARMKLADILPEFPEGATTTDLILFSQQKPDHIVVAMWPNGKLILPGTYFTPIKDSAENLKMVSARTGWSKFGVDSHIFHCLGVAGGKVATGKQTEQGYPRNSFIFVGSTTQGLLTPFPRNLPAGSITMEIPIFKPGTFEPSDEVVNGINGQGWGYEHNKEILLPWFYPFIETVDPDHQRSPLTLFADLR